MLFNINDLHSNQSDSRTKLRPVSYMLRFFLTAVQTSQTLNAPENWAP